MRLGTVMRHCGQVTVEIMLNVMPFTAKWSLCRDLVVRLKNCDSKTAYPACSILPQNCLCTTSAFWDITVVMLIEECFLE